LITAIILCGGLVLGFATGFMLSGLPMHMPERTRNFLASIPVLLALFVSGGLWGSAMAHRCTPGNARRAAWIAGLCFGLSVIIAGIGLSLLEMAVVERGRGPDLPVHRVYTLLFVPAVFFVAGMGGFALGTANRSWRLAGRLALWSGLTGALAFLLIDLVMDAMGWRVGAPGAAQRATMLTVTLAGSLAAAFTAGTALGVLLIRHEAESTEFSRPSPALTPE
jgi:cytochrome bd-type quinol oxidase subunit 2